MVSALVRDIRAALIAEADPERGLQQQAYMKSAMPFYGVSMPRVRALTREVARRYSPDLDTVEASSREIWDAATHREERHAALALTGLPVAKGRLQLVPLHEQQVRTGQWWDFTDEIAHRIADLLDAHPAEAAAQVKAWARADTFWLRRLAILSQLQRKQRTDTALLTEVIEVNAADTEFFIRKAIGWALRNYAFTDPDWVRRFVDAHELSPLSQREACKHL